MAGIVALRGGCPNVQVSFTVGDCQADGKRTVTFTVTVEPPPGGVVVTELDYGDGASDLATPALTYQRSHAYIPPGPYHPKVIIVLPEGCPDVPVPLSSLGGCPPGCPGPDDITVNVNGCDAYLQRIVSLTVLLPGVGATTGSVDWQDGSPVESASVQGGVPWTVMHAYPTPGPHKAKVTIKGCPPIIKAIGPLDTCPPPTDPPGHHNDDDDDKGLIGCRGLRWAFVILASLAGIAAFVGVCLSSNVLLGIGAGLALLSLFVFLFWRYVKRCPKPCGWALLSTWQIMLGIGVGVLHFTMCCPGAFLIGAILVAVAVSLILVWKKKCRATACRVYNEVAAVVAGVVLPVLGWVSLVAAGCTDPTIAVIVDTASAIMVLAALSCNDSDA